MKTPLALLALLASTPLALAQGSVQYTIKNSCPTTIALRIGESAEGNIAPGSSVVRTLGVNAGFFYTAANSGTTNGGATRAGFYGDNNSSYYYIVKDIEHFNTGISIAPSSPPNNGFCTIAQCDTVECPNAFSQPPTRFPPSSPTPPSLPVYACPGSNVSYTITFCPSGSFPPQPVVGSRLNPNGNPGKCVDVRGAILANGTPVQIYDCNGTPAQNWIFSRGITKVRLANTNFCLDAGLEPFGNGVGMKIWTCYDNLNAQSWNYTSNNHIALANQAYCLDLTEGRLTNANQLQTWQCYNGNVNQVWTIASP